MKKNRFFFLIIIICLVTNFTHAQSPATIKVKIINFPYLLVASNTYFKSEKEIKVEKIGDKDFLLSYYGKEPRLFYINFRDVLMSPGDSVELIYNRINSDPANHKDTLTVKGINAGNYIFSNVISDRMPKSFYPDHTQTIYQKNIRLLYNTISENHKKYAKMIEDNIEEYNCDKKLGAYLVRKSELRIIYELIFLENKLANNLTQKSVVGSLIDSIFLNKKYVQADTIYSGYLENAFKTYFDRQVTKKFNSLKTEKDYLNAIDYIKKFPDAFVREYFVYFLATDYKHGTSKYASGNFNELMKVNSHIGKTRNNVLDKENVYN